MALQEERVTTERRGHVLLIGLHRVAKRNAFDLIERNLWAKVNSCFSWWKCLF